MIHVTRASKQRIINQGKFIIRLLPLGNDISGQNDHGLYQLGRVDHATLEGGTLVPMHLHRNDEILSYIRKGTMVHKDSQENTIPITNQYLMMMNAGSGFYHEEGVPADGETVEMLQIFMRPRANNLTPQVQFHQLKEAYSVNKWRLIGGNEQSSTPLKINTEIEVYDVRIREEQIKIPEIENKTGYLYVFNGEIEIPEKQIRLRKGDALLLEHESLSVYSGETADLVLFVLDKNAPFSRSGLFAQ
nr:pirin family protein [uncultured Draconibacterium sp.]